MSDYSRFNELAVIHEHAIICDVCRIVYPTVGAVDEEPARILPVRKLTPDEHTAAGLVYNANRPYFGLIDYRSSWGAVRLAAEHAGWRVLGVHGTLFDFCPTCAAKP